MASAVTTGYHIAMHIVFVIMIVVIDGELARELFAKQFDKCGVIADVIGVPKDDYPKKSSI